MPIFVGRVGRLAVAGAAAAFASAGPARGTEPKPAAVFTGAPAAIVAHGRPGGGETLPDCTFFEVRLVPPATAAWIGTSGLGEARLALAPRGTCPPSDAWARHVQLATVDGPQTIALRLTSEEDRAEETTGRIVAIGEGGEIGSEKLVVRRESYWPAWFEMKWIAGIIVPALVAFLFARWTVARTERRAQWNNLVVFRTVDKSKVEKLMGDVKTTLDGKFKHPGGQILQSLRNNDILPNLPNRDKERLVTLCEQDKVDRAVRRFAKLFPLHAAELKEKLREKANKP
jgi:hypothetical protein